MKHNEKPRLKHKLSIAGWLLIGLAIIGALVVLVMIEGAIGLVGKATQYYSKSK